MKKSLSVLLVFALIIGMLMITACSSSEKSGNKTAVDETNLSFSTVADVKTPASPMNSRITETSRKI